MKLFWYVNGYNLIIRLTTHPLKKPLQRLITPFYCEVPVSTPLSVYKKFSVLVPLFGSRNWSEIIVVN